MMIKESSTKEDYSTETQSHALARIRNNWISLGASA
jgi:hypothetical protein